MRSFWQFGKGRNWDHQYLLQKTTFLSWFETSIQRNLPPSKAAHTTGARSFFFALMATQWVVLVVITAILNSNTQTTSHGGGLCLPKVLQIQIYNLRFIDTSICIQVTYKQQQSGLHLHLDTSVFSITCDDQDLQVPKLFYPGHPNLLCYNVREERTFQQFSHHYMKA